MVETSAAHKAEQALCYNVDGMLIAMTKTWTKWLVWKRIVIAPDDVIFMDETGDNTNQKKEAGIGNEKMIVPTDDTCNGKSGSTNGMVVPPWLLDKDIN